MPVCAWVITLCLARCTPFAPARQVAAIKHPCLHVQAVLEPFLYEYTSERGGSISAEHGLGQMKNQYMRYELGHERMFFFLTHLQG